MHVAAREVTAHEFKYAAELAFQEHEVCLGGFLIIELIRRGKCTREDIESITNNFFQINKTRDRGINIDQINSTKDVRHNFRSQIQANIDEAKEEQPHFSEPKNKYTTNIFFIAWKNAEIPFIIWLIFAFLMILALLELIVWSQ